MKTQLQKLKEGDKFYFASNSDLICVVTKNTGKKFEYAGYSENFGISKNTINYNDIPGKMPSVCPGNLVTIVK